jgi:hypothetical protein
MALSSQANIKYQWSQKKKKKKSSDRSEPLT